MVCWPTDSDFWHLYLFKLTVIYFFSKAFMNPMRPSNFELYFSSSLLQATIFNFFLHEGRAVPACGYMIYHERITWVLIVSITNPFLLQRKIHSDLKEAYLHLDPRGSPEFKTNPGGKNFKPSAKIYWCVTLCYHTSVTFYNYGIVSWLFALHFCDCK